MIVISESAAPVDVSDFGEPCKFLVSLYHCLIRCVCESLVHDPVAQQYYPKIMLTKAKKKRGTATPIAKAIMNPLCSVLHLGIDPTVHLYK